MMIKIDHKKSPQREELYKLSQKTANVISYPSPRWFNLLDHSSINLRGYDGLNHSTILQYLWAECRGIQNERERETIRNRIVHDVRFQSLLNNLTSKILSNPHYLTPREYSNVTHNLSNFHAFPPHLHSTLNSHAADLIPHLRPPELAMLISGLGSLQLPGGPLVELVENAERREVVEALFENGEVHNLADYARGISQLGGKGEVLGEICAHTHNVRYILDNSTYLHLSSILYGLGLMSQPSLTLAEGVLEDDSLTSYVNRESETSPLADMVEGIYMGNGCIPRTELLLRGRDDVIDELLSRPGGRDGLIEDVYGDVEMGSAGGGGEFRSVLWIMYGRCKSEGRNGGMKGCKGKELFNEVGKSGVKQEFDRAVARKGNTSDIGAYCYVLSKCHDPGVEFAGMLEGGEGTIRGLISRHVELRAASSIVNYMGKYGHKSSNLFDCLTGPEVRGRIIEGLEEKRRRGKRLRVVGGVREAAGYVEGIGKLGYQGDWGDWVGEGEGLGETLRVIKEVVVEEGEIEDFGAFLWGVCLINAGLGGMELLGTEEGKRMVEEVWDRMPSVSLDADVPEVVLTKFFNTMVVAKAAGLDLEMKGGMKSIWTEMMNKKVKNAFVRNKKMDNFSFHVNKMLLKAGVQETWVRFHSPFMEDNGTIGGGGYSTLSIQFAFPEEKVAWATDARNHFFRYSDEPNGLNKLRRRVLESQGWKVVTTSWLEWEYIRKNRRGKQQKEWAAGLLKKKGVVLKERGDEDGKWEDDIY